MNSEQIGINDNFEMTKKFLNAKFDCIRGLINDLWSFFLDDQDDLEESDMSGPIDFTNLKGLSVKITDGGTRAVSNDKNEGQSKTLPDEKNDLGQTVKNWFIGVMEPLELFTFLLEPIWSGMNKSIWLEP